MTIRDIFSEIINTPISELFLYLILISIVLSLLGWVVRKLLESETRNMYLSQEDRETRQIEELKEINPQRQDLTEEDFYKRILYENYSTFGYYYISGYTPKEEQNIWVHDIDEKSRLDTRIKFSESDVNLIMTTDEFKELIESQNYKSSESVEVVGRILKERGILFDLREVVLD